MRILRKYIGRPFLAVNEALWNLLPSSLTESALRPYGCFLHSLVKLRATRSQYFGTFFLRNRVELSMLHRLVSTQPQGATLKIAVLACSNGAEVYSIMWTILSRRPDLKLVVQAMDISNDILEIAQKGQYSLTAPELVDSPIFEYLTTGEMQTMFDKEGDQASVKPWLKEGIHWRVADARDSELVNVLGGQDIVFASKFLFHMEPAEAEKCLRNLVRLVNPEGHLFVSGVDLDVRSKVMRELGWTPVQEMLEEMHNGDSQVRRDWPWRYWGLEPFTSSRPDWGIYYASLFRAPQIKPATAPE
jgi:chemotaxis methyl-accepting protein methylase